MSTRLESETNEDNEGTGEGKQTGYPTFTHTVPNSSFRNPTPLDILDLFPLSPLSHHCHHFQGPPHTVASLPDPEEPEPAGNSSSDTRVILHL